MDSPPAKNLEKILLIVGSNDALFNTADMKSLIKKQPKLFHKTPYIVENPDRKDNFLIDKSAYFEQIENFLTAK